MAALCPRVVSGMLAQAPLDSLAERPPTPRTEMQFFDFDELDELGGAASDPQAADAASSGEAELPRPGDALQARGAPGACPPEPTARRPGRPRGGSEGCPAPAGSEALACAQRACEALMAAWEPPRDGPAPAAARRAPQSELEAQLADGARHIKRCFCTRDAEELFEVLHEELRRVAKTAAGPTGKIGLGPWSYSGGVGDTMEPMWKHSGAQEHAQDLKSLGFPTLSWVLSRLAEVFGTRVEFWWVNLYSTGEVGCKFHSDSNPKDTITAQASFGAARTLTMRHIASGLEFPYKQENGDAFAFDERVDRDFHHGLHPARPEVGPRISVLIIGRTHAGVHGFNRQRPRNDPEGPLLEKLEKQQDALFKLRRLLGLTAVPERPPAPGANLQELVSEHQAEIDRLRQKLQRENPMFRYTS